MGMHTRTAARSCPSLPTLHYGSGALPAHDALSGHGVSQTRLFVLNLHGPTPPLPKYNQTTLSVQLVLWCSDACLLASSSPQIEGIFIMSFTLTTTAPSRTQVTIDLTLTPDTPSSAPSPPASSGFDLFQSQRRPRASIEDDTRSPKRPKRERRVGQSQIGQCLTKQIVPLVRDVTRSLPRAEFNVDKIGELVRK